MNDKLEELGNRIKEPDPPSPIEVLEDAINMLRDLTVGARNQIEQLEMDQYWKNHSPSMVKRLCQALYTALRTRDEGVAARLTQDDYDLLRAISQNQDSDRNRSIIGAEKAQESLEILKLAGMVVQMPKGITEGIYMTERGNEVLLEYLLRQRNLAKAYKGKGF